jgi:hypothetical protein
MSEVAAIKDSSREVEMGALPGNRSVLLQMTTDQTKDCVPDLALTLGSGFGLVGQSDVGAEDIDAAGPPNRLPGGSLRRRRRDELQLCRAQAGRPHPDNGWRIAADRHDG